MATSGSSNFSLTAREVVDFALKKLRVVDAGRVAGATEAATAQRELNVMLKGWQKYPALWRLTEGAVGMTNATASYDLATVAYFVNSVRFRSASIDYPLILMTRGAYFSLPVRSTAGDPKKYFVDRQVATTTLFVYPVKATITSQTFNYTYQRRFEDIDSLDNDLDVRPAWLEVVGYNLAARLAPDFGRAGPSVEAIRKTADQLLQEAFGVEQQDASDARQMT